jgi:ABC-type antimicrobial peptide transport system permease subunit
MLVALFTIAAVILALSGTWGVMSFRISQHTQEIGIRVAFGASRRQIVWYFIRQGLRLTGVGGGAGIAFTLVLMTLLGASVYGIQAVQVLYLVLALLILAALMFLATALPAMKTTRVDPVDALRVE